jgi:hypothetical protein
MQGDGAAAEQAGQMKTEGNERGPGWSFAGDKNKIFMKEFRERMPE